MRLEPLVLRDLLYFDVARAESIYSQFFGGLLSEYRTEAESASSTSSATRASLQAVTLGTEASAHERNLRAEHRVLHHALLVELESVLFSIGAAVDVNSAARDDPAASPRELLRGFTYIRAEGHAGFEDYARLKTLAEQFNDLLESIARSVAGDVMEQLPQLQALQNEMQQASLVASATEGKRKAEAMSRFLTARNSFRNQLLALAGQRSLPDWLIEAIELWVDLFLPDRVSFLLYPFEDQPGFRIVGNVKRDAFVHEDMDGLRASYGSYPDVPLTILGIITSAPPEDRAVPLPIREFDVDLPGSVQAEARLNSADPAGGDATSARNDDESQPPPASNEDVAGAFEQAFRRIFAGAEAMERTIRFTRYPSIVVQPIAIYRTVRVELRPARTNQGFLATLKRLLRLA
jgi:hypothetical protein